MNFRPLKWKADRSILDKLPAKNPYRKRAWREVLRDAWLGLRGKTFVTMRGHCFRCGRRFHIECYQDCLFPIRPRCGCEDPVSLDMMNFNGSSYWPTQLMKENPASVLEVKTGDHLTIEESKALEERVGYGGEWWQEDTIRAIQDRYAVRQEHRKGAE
jgi:hypothetical protein